jgi:hypothetical protein
LEIFRRRGGPIFSASGPDNDVPFIGWHLEKVPFSWEDWVYLFPSNGATCDGAHFRWLRFSPSAADRSLSAEKRNLLFVGKRSTDSMAVD